MSNQEDLTFSLVPAMWPINREHSYQGSVFCGNSFSPDTVHDLNTTAEGLAFRLFFPEHFKAGTQDGKKSWIMLANDTLVLEDSHTQDGSTNGSEQPSDKQLTKEDLLNSKWVDFARDGRAFLASAETSDDDNLPSGWTSREKTHFSGLTSWVNFSKGGKDLCLDVVWRRLPKEVLDLDIAPVHWRRCRDLSSTDLKQLHQSISSNSGA